MAVQADMGGWVRHMLTRSLPQPLLRWSSIWYTVIKPVVHHNIMLRNRVRHIFPTCLLAHAVVSSQPCTHPERCGT